MEDCFQETYLFKLAKLKDEVLKKVVKQVLGRDDFTDSEVKDFHIVIHTEHPGREFIGYKGNMIGEMVFFHREQDNQLKMGFEFVPKTIID